MFHIAKDKYHQSSIDYRSIHRLSDGIFPPQNHHENSLQEISTFFQKHLNDSWQKLQADPQETVEHLSNEKIEAMLRSLRQQSRQFWRLLIKSIELSNEILFKIGSVTRLTPTTLISLFLQQTIHSKEVGSLVLTNDQCSLLGGLMVNWTLEQRLERALLYAHHGKMEEYEKEISSIPHTNWKPSKHLAWLILELEMNITIRKIQVDVARHMMQSSSSTNTHQMQNLVMQMNMGEGKTSVILPMLALSLSSSSSTLVRIIVLKSLFPMNYQALKHKLGGLLNRRIFPFASRRDMNFDQTQIEQIFYRFERALANYDVIMTSPEDLLSFELLTIDKCRQKKFELARSMLSMQRWLKRYARDILDESDEILHVKYQLIYTVGGQQQVDGGVERWKTIQIVLQLVKRCAEDIAKEYKNEIYYQSPERSSAFPQFRLQSSQPYSQLCQKIAHQWINQRHYRQADHPVILSKDFHRLISIDF